MEKEAVEAYYNTHIEGKVRGFVEKNPRIERAWATVLEYAPPEPVAILEVGCGIGDICHRMSTRWPLSQVTGMDISSKSIDFANRAFSSSKVHFVQGILNKDTVSGSFDLILLMDVYEHIAGADRPALHEAFRQLLSDRGTLVLTCPTPRYLAYLGKYVEGGLQPVDEDITAEVALQLASDTGTELIKYEEVSIWHPGDYVHIVLRKPEKAWTPETYRGKVLRTSFLEKLYRRVSLLPGMIWRKQWIKSRLIQAADLKTFENTSLSC